MWNLVCLCGHPLIPAVNAGTGPRAWQAILRLLADLKRAQQGSKAYEEAGVVLQAAAVERQELRPRAATGGVAGPALRADRPGSGRRGHGDSERC